MMWTTFLTNYQAAVGYGMLFCPPKFFPQCSEELLRWEWPCMLVIIYSVLKFRPWAPELGCCSGSVVKLENISWRPHRRIQTKPVRLFCKMSLGKKIIRSVSCCEVNWNIQFCTLCSLSFNKYAHTQVYAQTQMNTHGWTLISWYAAHFTEKHRTQIIDVKNACAACQSAVMWREVWPDLLQEVYLLFTSHFCCFFVLLGIESMFVFRNLSHYRCDLF